MSTYNTNTNGTNKETKNPYGHLLDKYLDSNHVDWENSNLLYMVLFQILTAHHIPSLAPCSYIYLP